MKAAEKCVVKLNYVLRVDDNKGEIKEQTTPERPFAFLFGAGQLLPKFEQNISGLQGGDKFAFAIAKDEAYGDANPEAVVNLPKANFEVDGKVDPRLLEIGRIIPMRNEQGHPLNGRVLAVADNEVTLDFNHPMAGMNLHFSGEILEVRAASDEEMAHGHAHGVGGHQH